MPALSFIPIAAIAAIAADRCFMHLLPHTPAYFTHLLAGSASGLRP
jgi:branched-subunit amino acid transport protein